MFRVYVGPLTPATAARREPTRLRFWQDASVQTKTLAVILPLVVLPVLVLAAVGFVTSSREAAYLSPATAVIGQTFLIITAVSLGARSSSP